MPRPNNIHIRRTSTRTRPQAQPEPEPEGIRKLRAELERKTRILESSLLSLDTLISPLDWLDSGDGFPGFGSWRFVRPVNRTQDRTHAPINYLNEEEWRWSVAYGRDLCTRNHLAIGFRDHVSNFIGPIAISFVLRGQSPGATSSGPDEADSLDTPAVDPLVRECTTAWEEWCELAEWGQGELDREEECRKRWIVEGECTLRFFEGDGDSDGLPYVRHIEPELIRTPPGHSTIDHWGWGVRTADDDDERELGLWVCHPENVSEGKVVEAEEYVRLKGNVDRTIRRGLSDFFPVAEQLRKVMGLLDNMAHVARLQAAIAWWEQFPTASMSQVQSLMDAGADYQRTKLPPNVAGSNVDVANYEPGTVVRTEQRQVNPGPVSTGATQFAQVEQMVLRGVGFRWGCPSYFSGDGQDSFASVLVTGSPFVRITESRQEKFKGFCRRVAARVLEYCEESGRLPAGTCKRVRPIATARPVVIADEEKQARTFLSLYEKNCADPVEFIRKRGGDPKVVAANIAAWQKKFAPQQGQGGSQASGSAGPVPGPTPTPPGSAGGDGSSPSGEAVAEARQTFNPAQHPRDDHGQFIDKGDIEAAKTDPAKAAALRQRVTNPEELNKLNAALGKPSPQSGTRGVLTAKLSKKKIKSSSDLHAVLANQTTEHARVEAIRQRNLKGKHGSEAVVSVILGSDATPQTKGSQLVKLAGQGHDFVLATADTIELPDAKSRASAKRSIRIPEGSEESKMQEVLELMEKHPSSAVIPSKLHVADGNHTHGVTFTIGFPPLPGSTKDTTYSHKPGGKSGKLFTKFEDWKAAIDNHLQNQDPNKPFPALQLNPHISLPTGTLDFDEVGKAREQYEKCVEHLSKGVNRQLFQDLVKKQITARVEETIGEQISVLKAKKELTEDTLKNLFDNWSRQYPTLTTEFAKMHAVQKAAINNATADTVKANMKPEELTKLTDQAVADATPDQHKTAAQNKTPDEIKAIIAAYQAALAAQTGQTPTPPTS